MTSRKLFINFFCGSYVEVYNFQINEYYGNEILHKCKNPQFFDQFQHIFNLKHVKAFIFTTELSEFKSFIEEYKFRQKCNELCKKHEIYYFPYHSQIYASTAFLNTETRVKEGEHVLIILPKVSGMDILIREKKGYKIVKMGPLNSGRKKFFGNYNPKKIAFLQPPRLIAPEYVERMKNFFKNGSFEIFSMKNTTSFSMSTVEKLYCKYFEPQASQLAEEIKLSKFKTKKVKVTLKLDINSFYDFKVEPFVGEEEEAIANVAEKLCKENIGADKKTIEEAAKNNDKENGERKPALNDSEAVEIDKQSEKVQMVFGEVKTPIYIAFTDMKSIIGKTAVEIYKEKPKFVACTSFLFL